MFGENLQKLRKEKNISQEQLAEKLGVTRQSVSKWESGTSYPEMDKIVTLCKIFNCDIDTIINKDVMEEKKKKDATGIIKNILKQIAIYIEETVRLFEHKTFKEIIKLCAQIFLIFIVILLFKIPFNILSDVLSKVFYFNNNEFLSTFFSKLWQFIFDTSYVILAISSFLYIFKIKFLIDDNNTNYNKTNNDLNKNIKDTKSDNSITKVKSNIDNTIKENTITDLLAKVITIFIKFMLLLFLFPIITIDFFSIISFTLLIILIFKKLFLIGPILISLSLAAFTTLISLIIIKFIINLKVNKNKSLIAFLISFIIGTIGVALTIWMVLNLNICQDAPVKENKLTETFEMTDNLIIHEYYDSINYIEDNSLGNNIEVTAKYYDTIKNLTIENEDGILVKYEIKKTNNKKIINDLINDLRNGKLYTYKYKTNVDLEVKANSDNIKKLKDNIKKDEYDDDYENDDY